MEVNLLKPKQLHYFEINIKFKEGCSFTQIEAHVPIFILSQPRIKSLRY
jgi:hypothetical protein